VSNAPWLETVSGWSNKRVSIYEVESVAEVNLEQRQVGIFVLSQHIAQ
jgi:hypothetical protein